MKMVLSVYGINAAAFALNITAVLIYTMLAGPIGYGSYAIYVVIMAIFFVMDVALVKAALVRRQKFLEAHPENVAEAAGNRLLTWYRLPLVIASVPLYLIGDVMFPTDLETGVGGSFVMAVAIVEHAFSQPANRLTYHLTIRERFREVYALRLVGTVLRHGFAWVTLLLTGSILVAIAAIVLKGLVIGIAAQWANARSFPMPSLAEIDRSLPGFGVLASFFGAAMLLLVLQEIPAIYIDRAYGREALGQYRILYDIAVAVWFVATIYPSILFTRLLRNGAAGDRARSTAELGRLGDQLAYFHGAYCFGAIAILAAERWMFGFFASAPYAEGVIAGVCILGFNRFLMEAAQAYGLARWSLSVALLGGLVVSALLLYHPPMDGAPEIGWAWLAGQIVIYVALKATLVHYVLLPSLRVWREALFFVLPTTTAAVVLAPGLQPLVAAQGAIVVSICYSVAFLYVTFVKPVAAAAGPGDLGTRDEDGN